MNIHTEVPEVFDDRGTIRWQDFYRKILAQRDEILRAFIAKYGYGPEEAEQVITDGPDGIRYWVQRKKED